MTTIRGRLLARLPVTERRLDAAGDPAHEQPGAFLHALRAALADVPVPPSDRSRS